MEWSYHDLLRLMGTLEGRDALNQVRPRFLGDHRISEKWTIHLRNALFSLQHAVIQTIQYLSLLLVPYFENLDNQDAAKRLVKRWTWIGKQTVIIVERHCCCYYTQTGCEDCHGIWKGLYVPFVWPLSFIIFRN